MKRLLFWLIILGVCGAAVAAGGPPLRRYWTQRHLPRYRTEKITRGDLVFHIHATGKVEPVLKVNIGSFVSGPIDTTVKLADFNQKVSQGEVLARIDQRIYQAAVFRDKATLATAKAEVARMTALLQQAKNDERRSQELRKINKDYISDTEMDQYRFARESLEAQLTISEQSIVQAEGQLQNSQLNLGYTDIVAPSDGIIIDRKIHPGQTLAAQFQTPELFVLAVDMDKRMWVHANVVEADLGPLMKAHQQSKPVEFRVDAYDAEWFTGRIHQIRQNSVTEQNVVTYPVVIETVNDEMKLLPGMTANIDFEIERRSGVLRIPGAALRYWPEVALVREGDKKLLEGKGTGDEDPTGLSAKNRAEASRKQKRRHVWIKDGAEGELRAVEVELGISEEGRWYEMVSGSLQEGQELVVGKEI